MKRFIKVIIPLLLAVSIIASIGWYLFIYDTDFTRDQLISLARRFEEDGNQSLAIELYNMAYVHSEQDSAVAIELAKLFSNAGNYTKAEYTISHAIADGGGLDLYVELCKLYIEQDKLIDAVNMLDNVADPLIKEQLDSMRPAMPVPTPDAGTYNQYMDVTFQNTIGTIYACANADYPSIADGPCTAPISLRGGKTTILAVTVGDNGLVSPLQTLNYTIAGVIEQVSFTDAAMERTVRELLGVSDDHVLYTNELWEITSLIIPEDAQTLVDLTWLPLLEQVTIKNGSISDLEPLATLSSLSDLVIMNTSVNSADLAFIAGLPKLTNLTLRECGLSGISELSAATGLKWLDLSGNIIGNISPLEPMTKLEYLDLSYNALTSLDALQGMQQLVELYASYNSINSTAALSSCTALNVVDLDGNLLTSLEGLEKLPTLRTLTVAFNQLTDVSNLSACTTIGDLDISNNQLTDITALSTLNQLLNFNFSYNQVTQLPEFSKDCPMVYVKGSANALTSLKPLGNLNNLNYVIMDQNPGLTSVSSLKNCHRLLEVSVYGTGVTDVSKLKEILGDSVTIFYSPIPVT